MIAMTTRITVCEIFQKHKTAEERDLAVYLRSLFLYGILFFICYNKRSFQKSFKKWQRCHSQRAVKGSLRLLPVR